MTFVYNKVSDSVRDDDSGIEIAPNWGFRDGVDTFNYKFKLQELEFDFEIIFSSVPYTYRTTVASEVTGLAKGSETTGFVTDAVYVLEQGFRQGLQNIFSKMGKPDLTQVDYVHFKNLLEKGLTVLFTEEGNTLQRIPDGRFHLEFEDNLLSMAKRHPEKLKHFKLSHHQKSSQQGEMCT